MTEYEKALDIADRMGYRVDEIPLQANDGRVVGKDIYLRRGMTSIEKRDTTWEELWHGEITVGNILDQDSVNARKQERLARFKSYDSLMILPGIIKARVAGCRNAYEIAECIGISESTFREALEMYKQKFGRYIYLEGYIIQFEPALQVFQFKHI